jgi:uroporphyrinogen decarboxylase
MIVKLNAPTHERTGVMPATSSSFLQACQRQPDTKLKGQADRVLNQAVQADGNGYIFNVGHGIFPATPPDNVRRLVDLAHEHPLSGGWPC